MSKTTLGTHALLTILMLVPFLGCEPATDLTPTTDSIEASTDASLSWWRRRRGTGGATNPGLGGSMVGSGGSPTQPGTGGSTPPSVGGSAGATSPSTGGVLAAQGGTASGGAGVAGSSGNGSNPRQACASEPMRTTGQVYYVCDCQAGAAASCVAGNDSNSGTSPAAPLQSFRKAASVFSSMNAGDTVALCRGGRWNITSGSGFANAKCNKSSTCDLRDYAPPSSNGSEALPSIWINGGSNGGTIMSFSHTPSHQEGFRVMNLDLHGTNKDTGLFFWNETTDVDLCDLSMDGFNISVNMSGGDGPTYGIPANIVLRGSRITNNSNIGYIAVCDRCVVEDNFFDNNGVGTATTHAVYFASTVWTVNGQSVIHETDGMRLSRNEIHHSAVECKGSPVVVHGRHKNVIIEYNTVDAVTASDGCWGPGVGCGAYPYGCWFRNTIIRGNVIKNLGNVGSENDNCADCLIENNLIVMNRSGSGINLGGKSARPAGHSEYTRSDGRLDDSTDRARVHNNTIYFTAGAASGDGIAASSGTGHVLHNNAIYFAAASSGPSGNRCYRTSGSTSSVLASADYNVCLVPSGGQWSGSMNLGSWQSSTGLDSHSRMTDPMFQNAPTDFTPASGSPLIGTAEAGCSPSADLCGQLRDSSPDIGAYERH